MRFPKLTQSTVVCQQVTILCAPGVGTAIEGVFAALHAGLIAVVNTGTAGQGVLQECGQK